MIDAQKIEALARLARIDMGKEELSSLAKSLDEILEYVSQLEKLSLGTDDTPVFGENKNMMREDGIPHESGRHTKDLLVAAPRHDKRFIKVDKVLKNG